MYIYVKRNAFSLLQKEAILVAFRIARLKELKKNRTLESDGIFSYIGPALWKIKMLRTSSAIGMHLACHQKHVIEATKK